MTKEQLLGHICLADAIEECCSEEGDTSCEKCELELSILLNQFAKQIKEDVIEECADKFADILSNVPNLCGRSCPVKCNWGTEKSCKDMCKKWLLEQLKEK